MASRFKLLNQGFTLLEVIITISLLSVIMIAVTELFKSSFDLKDSLSSKATINHRLNISMNRISTDLEHAFLLSNQSAMLRTGGSQRTVFKITKNTVSDSLAMTYMHHTPRFSNAKESNLSYVVYEVKESTQKQKKGRHLYRGEYLRINEGFSEPPPMHMIAENIDAIYFEAWNGSEWSKDSWNQNGSESEYSLPQMVKITIKALVNANEVEDKKAVFDQYTTTVYLPYALDFAEAKERSSQFRL